MTSPSNRLLRVSEVAALLGVSTSAIYKWTKAGDFPQPLVLGDESNKRTASRWVLMEIEDWVNSRPREKTYDKE